MSNKPPAGSEQRKEDKQPKARKRAIFISLLIIELTLASTILTLGVRKFSIWYRITRPKKRQYDVLFSTILLIATCAPTCVFFGMLVAASHYYRKRKKHGEYEVNMRRHGRGYIMDPSDAEDLRKGKEALRINAEIVKKAKEQNEQKEIGKTIRLSEQSTLAPVPALERMSMVASWASGAGTTSEVQPGPTNTSSKYSSVIPYGWAPKAEEPEEPKEPQRFVGRSDSWKAYKNSPVTREEVDNIWLSGGGKRASDGKSKVKSSWDDDVELGTVRKNTM